MEPVADSEGEAVGNFGVCGVGGINDIRRAHDEVRPLPPAWVSGGLPQYFQGIRLIHDVWETSGVNRGAEEPNPGRLPYNSRLNSS